MRMELSRSAVIFLRPLLLLLLIALLTSVAVTKAEELNDGSATTATTSSSSNALAGKDSLVNRLEMIVNKVKSIKARLNQTLNETSLQAMQHELLTRTGYNYTAGVGYHKFYVERMSWNEAFQHCRKRDSHLAVVDSSAEAAVITDIVKHRQSLSPHVKVLAYIGVHDYSKASTWITIFFNNFESSKYVSWEEGMLNRVADDSLAAAAPQCAAIDENGRLHSLDCAEKRPFVCESES